MNDQGTDTLAPVASVTVTVVEYLPAVVPVPVSAPVVGLSVMPGGSAPSAENVYGPRPPTALTPVVSAALTATLAVSPVVGGFAAGERLQLERREDEDRELPRVSLVPLPFAWTVKLNVPLCVGVPEMTPFEASVSPGGSVPPASDHEFTVSPEAVSAGAVYAWLMFASGRPASRRSGAGRGAVDVDRELAGRTTTPGALPPCPQVYDTVM